MIKKKYMHIYLHILKNLRIRYVNLSRFSKPFLKHIIGGLLGLKLDISTVKIKNVLVGRQSKI